MKHPERVLLAGFLSGGLAAWLIHGDIPPLSIEAPSPQAGAPAPEPAADLAVGAPVSAAAAESEPSSWVAGQVMVTPTDPEGLAELAARWGAEVIRPVRRSGAAVLSVPAGETAESFLAALRAEGAIRGGSPHGRIEG